MTNKHQPTTPAPIAADDKVREALKHAIEQTEKALRPVEQEYMKNPSQGVFWFTANIFHVRTILAALEQARENTERYNFVLGYDANGAYIERETVEDGSYVSATALDWAQREVERLRVLLGAPRTPYHRGIILAKREVLAKQINQVKHLRGHTVDCAGCSKPIPITEARKCHWCGCWYGRCCADEHFGTNPDTPKE